MIYGGPGFLAVVGFGSSPTRILFPPVFLCVAGILTREGGGVGVGAKSYESESGSGSDEKYKQACGLYNYFHNVVNRQTT